MFRDDPRGQEKTDAHGGLSMHLRHLVISDTSYGEHHPPGCPCLRAISLESAGELAIQNVPFEGEMTAYPLATVIWREQQGNRQINHTLMVCLDFHLGDD